ncbi:hypothetical protein SFC27_20705 [Bacillus licheniformis]|jgi:hypothetical protein|uniref:Yip1 domain-containing protein n=12 Tax=Bacillus licheniformis TaxID=1402 RepID=Q65GD4_BACLD|nr:MULTISPECIES: hypothetical protein [Bacillus]MBJ7886575.1 hypothetical protein [Bacillaceae bacterium HSR45]MBY8347511.1 hypothetical protein [Bacillus sp. PCH94]MDP4082648.1 hypothetical protein [Bacillota bacterium]AAU24522.1 hypothetical protein BL00308 [Bacillus licheniformis DSM 13 = ATCC 14580]AAU41880.1 hypothetical protein BLi03014 [Bacillus licheniformis DSM 13 = ATCC 14580]
MKKTKFNLICICLLSGAAALCVSILKMNEIDASLHELNEDEYGNLITISKWIGITIAVIGEAIKPLLELLFFTLIIWLAIMIFGAKDSFKNIFSKGVLSYYFNLVGSVLVIVFYLFGLKDAESLFSIPFLRNLNIFSLISLFFWCYLCLEKKENSLKIKYSFSFFILFLFSIAISIFSDILA